MTRILGPSRGFVEGVCAWLPWLLPQKGVGSLRDWPKPALSPRSTQVPSSYALLRTNSSGCKSRQQQAAQAAQLGPSKVRNSIDRNFKRWRDVGDIATSSQHAPSRTGPRLARCHHPPPGFVTRLTQHVRRMRMGARWASSKFISQMKPRQPAHSLHRGLHSEVLGAFILCVGFMRVSPRSITSTIQPLRHCPSTIPHPQPAPIPLTPAPAPGMAWLEHGQSGTERQGQGAQAAEEKRQKRHSRDRDRGMPRPRNPTQLASWHPGTLASWHRILASHPSWQWNPSLPIASPSRDCAKPCAS